MNAHDFEVHVTGVTEGDVTSYLTGYFLFHGERFSFTGIAYGRFGGQNVHPVLSNRVKKRLQRLGVTLDEFEEALQQKLLQGDVTIEASPPE